MPYKSPEARRQFVNKWRRAHPEVSRRWRANHLPQNRALQLENTTQKRYGLTRTQQVELRTKACEICGKNAKKMCIDHNHKEPKSFRGVLCQHCNTRLGWLEKNMNIILEYTQREARYASDLP